MDWSGKTTQMHRLAARLRSLGRAVMETVEPGGPPVAQKIRRILLDSANPELSPTTEILLYFASRAQNVDEWIRSGNGGAGRSAGCPEDPSNSAGFGQPGTESDHRDPALFRVACAKRGRVDPIWKRWSRAVRRLPRRSVEFCWIRPTRN